MRGCRIAAAQDGSCPSHFGRPGDYGFFKMRGQDPSVYEDVWLVCVPDGTMCRLNPPHHRIEIHEDTSISVFDTISTSTWQGTLREGVWQTLRTFPYLLSPKLQQYDASRIAFYCPGCDMLHPVGVEPNPNGYRQAMWNYSGFPDSVTLSPSVSVELGPNKKCHSYVRNGKIEYLSDCFHSLKSTTIDIPDIPQDQL